MIGGIFRMIGRGFILAASTAILVAASCFLLGSYLVTWPVLRKSPRQRHLRAAMDLAASAMTMMAVLNASNESGERITDTGFMAETGNGNDNE